MRVACIALLVAGCGLGPFTEDTSAGGGDSNLPIAGLGPYGKLAVDFDTPADEPVILEDDDADLLAPSALTRDDGGYRVFFERRTADGGEIWVVEIPALTELPDVAPRLVLAATEPWEGGDLRAPSVARADDGSIVMVYEAGDAAIGRAVSTDDGQTFVRDSAPVLEGAESPSVVLDAETTQLFYERADRRNLFRSIDENDADGVTFALSDTPILQIDQSVPEAFDRAQVMAPAAVATVSATGQERLLLFYEGHSGERVDGELETAIGVASAIGDGPLARPFPVGEPILDPGAPFESAPSVVLEPTRGVMFFSEARGARARISAAVSP